MNPLIHFGTLSNGVLTIPMGEPCKCKIGLVSLELPSVINSHKYLELNIHCDQLDSNMFNRKRLLRRIYRNTQPNSCLSFEFQNILYFPVDSMDDKLTIRLHDQNGPLRTNGLSNGQSNLVTVCLDVLPELDSRERWKNYIKD